MLHWPVKSISAVAPTLLGLSVLYESNRESFPVLLQQFVEKDTLEYCYSGIKAARDMHT